MYALQRFSMSECRKECREGEEELRTVIGRHGDSLGARRGREKDIFRDEQIGDIKQKRARGDRESGYPDRKEGCKPDGKHRRQNHNVQKTDGEHFPEFAELPTEKEECHQDGEQEQDTGNQRSESRPQKKGSNKAPVRRHKRERARAEEEMNDCVGECRDENPDEDPEAKRVRRPEKRCRGKCRRAERRRGFPDHSAVSLSVFFQKKRLKHRKNKQRRRKCNQKHFPSHFRIFVKKYVQKCSFLGLSLCLLSKEKRSDAFFASKNQEAEP